MDMTANSLMALKPSTLVMPQKTANNARVQKASEDFEAMFISEMIKPMFEDITTDGMFGGGKGEDVFRGLLIQEFGKNIARQGGIGLSDQVRASLLKSQEQC